MDEPILCVNDLGIGFGSRKAGREAVCGAFFDLEKGKTLALVGESGSGKSLTCRAIMGLLPISARITRGSVMYNDPEAGKTVDLLKISERRKRAIRGSGISMIFQEPMSSLSPFHTIGSQVSEALLLHTDCDKRDARDHCLMAFDKVGFHNPARAFDAYPFELSGGMRQRAMIAMATICEPALLIADEPTTALDVTTQALILDLIEKRQAQTNMAVLLVTHDLGIVANCADYITVMRKGKVMESGPARDLLKTPRHRYLNRLIDAAPDIQPDKAHDPQPKRDLIVQTTNVSKTFVSKGRGLFGLGGQSVRALQGINLDIPRGETVALVGESGSGKSTLAKIIMCDQRPDPGSTIVYDLGDGPFESDQLSKSEMMRFRQGVQIVFQDPYSSLSPRMTVQDILMEPMQIHNVGDAASRRERCVELMEKVGLLPEHLVRFPHAFSGGQRQRIAIARALTLEPRLLICDEPTSALDVSVQAQMLELLEELGGEFNLSYLFISHDLAVVSRLADEIAVMCRGMIVEQAPARKLFEDPEHPYTRALMAAAPDPDPDHPLDLDAILVGAGAQPEEWPEAFRYDHANPPPLREVETNHFVRMQA